MRNKKNLIIILTIFAIAGFVLGTSDFHLKYIAAGILYDTENTLNGKMVFSKRTGFYDEEFYLKMYAPSDEIYYTLDGSEPSKDSMKYEGPVFICDATQNENTNSMRTDFSGGFLHGYSMYSVPEHPIDKCTVVKAAYYDKNGNRSKTEERVYFVRFGEKSGYDDVNIISITAEPEDLFGYEDGIYVLGKTFEEYAASVDIEQYEDYLWKGNYSNSGIEWERPVHVQVFNTEKEHVLSQKVGLRIQGGVSRSFYPKSLNLYARNEYGSNQMQYDFFETGYYPQRVTLSSGGNDYYGKMMDRLGAEVTRDCKICTMHYVPYVLFLNGEYWGFYYMTEKYDEHYIEHYYSVDKDNVIMIKQKGLEVGTDDDYTFYEDMMAFVGQADMTIEENYAKACEMLDMESFIDYYAAEIYMARKGDWPSANFALWRSRNVSSKEYEDGKWRWMLFDVNTAALSEDLAEHDTIAYVMEDCELFANLSKNPSFRKDFSDRLREMRDIVFEMDLVNGKLDEYKALMSEPMEKHFQRFFTVSSEEFHQKRRGIRKFIAERQNYIEIMLKNNEFI